MYSSIHHHNSGCSTNLQHEKDKLDDKRDEELHERSVTQEGEHEEGREQQPLRRLDELPPKELRPVVGREEAQLA